MNTCRLVVGRLKEDQSKPIRQIPHCLGIQKGRNVRTGMARGPVLALGERRVRRLSGWMGIKRDPENLVRSPAEW